MEQFNHGAIHQPIRRKATKVWRKVRGKVYVKGMGVGVDWQRGSQFKDKLVFIPIKNQGINFSCGGQAGSTFLQIQRIIQGNNEGEISAKSIYDPIAYPFGGTTVNDLQMQLATRGANLESAVSSYDANKQPLSEEAMKNKSSQTPSLIKDAFSRAGYTPYDINDDIDSVAEAINTYGAVIWKITGQDGNVPGWRSATPQPPSKANKNTLWYHFMCAYDFQIDSNGKKRIVAFQSEGPDWGDHGKQYFYENYFTGKHLDAFTLIYDKNITPTKDNTSVWAAVARWFRSLWGLK